MLELNINAQNVIAFPDIAINKPVVDESRIVPTPHYDAIVAEAEKLDRVSKYKSEFDYEIYKSIELRYADKPIRGGITLKKSFRLVNANATCQQCLYSFEVDTYGRGCLHDCVYCYAKAQLTVHGWWNAPIPVPVNVNELRKTFYTVFETDKRSEWREVLERRIPIRIGSMSDSFMWSDTKYKVTQELLKILKFYNYPYIVFTRSDLVAHDEYIRLLDPSLASIQFSMSSTNDALIKQIEPGAPSSKRRLKAINKLAENGFWTTVRINPLFPIYPDGYFTDPNFKWDGEVPKFEYSSFEMIDEIAAHKAGAVLAGFVRFSHMSLNSLERATGFNLREFYNRNAVNKSRRDYHYSDREIRYYYEELKKRSIKNALEFTTCYIGNGESHFWKDQDLWSNKIDCCNAKGKVASFKTDSRELPFDLRLKHTVQKTALPTSDRLHEALVAHNLPKNNKPTIGESHVDLHGY